MAVPGDEPIVVNGADEGGSDDAGAEIGAEEGPAVSPEDEDAGGVVVGVSGPEELSTLR